MFAVLRGGAAGVVPDAEASLLDALDAALEAKRELSELAERQRAEIAELREQNARLVELCVPRISSMALSSRVALPAVRP